MLPILFNVLSGLQFYGIKVDEEAVAEFRNSFQQFEV